MIGPIKHQSQCHATIANPEIILILFTPFHSILGHINNKQSNNARQFPGDFAKFQ